MGVYSPFDAVIVDTSVFCKEQLDFIGLQNEILPSFFQMLEEKGIVLLTHPILLEETRKHIAESEVINKLSNLKMAMKKYRNMLPLIGLSSENIERRIDELDLNRRLVSAFEKFYADAIVLPYPNAEIVFSQYFSCRPPFSATGDKKSEFPDAFVILAVKQYLFTHPDIRVLVLTNDSDWQKSFADTQRVVLADSIGTGIRMMQSSEDILPIFNEAIPEIETNLIDLLEMEAFNLIGFEVIDDVEITSIRIKSVSDRIVPLKISDDRLILRTTADIEVDGNAMIMDEDRSVWDSEEKGYIFTAYSNIFFENASAEIDFDVELSIDSEEGKHTLIEVENIKLDTTYYDIELDIDLDNVSWTDMSFDMDEDAE